MPVRAKNYKALTGQGDGQAKNYTLAEMGDLCNDNLLINSDFRSGIINQKKQTSYAGNGSNNFYTIDMWYATKNVTVTVHDGYVNFKNNSTEINYVIQILNEQPNENYCSAVNVKSIVGTCFSRTQNKDFTKLHEDLNLVKGLNIISFNGAVKRTGIYLGANASIDIEFIKLEKGSYFTGMPAWNEADELNKCQYYFERIYLFSDEWSWFSNAYVITRNNKSSFSLFFKQKAKVPSVTLNGLLKILFYETWYDCTKEGAVSVTKNNFRFSFSYPQEANRANGTSCPVALVRQDTEPYIDIDSYNY